jgi:hypothetical protein
MAVTSAGRDRVAKRGRGHNKVAWLGLHLQCQNQQSGVRAQIWRLEDRFHFACPGCFTHLHIAACCRMGDEVY